MSRHSKKNSAPFNGTRVAVLLLVAAICFLGYLVFASHNRVKSTAALPAISSHGADKSDEILARAFSNRLSNIKVSGQGVVVKVLPDDNFGNRHQRFIIKLSSGQTLLVAHNIDIASRIAGLLAGDEIKFLGEYEWNDQGGVVHNTHHDPGGRHSGGWIEHAGKRYE
jgi:Protein of unknown function (DUF3465)